MTKLEEIYSDLRALRRSVENMNAAVGALEELIDESKRKMDVRPGHENQPASHNSREQLHHMGQGHAPSET